MMGTERSWRWRRLLTIGLVVLCAIPGLAGARPSAAQQSSDRNPHALVTYPRLGWQFTPKTEGQLPSPPQVAGDMVLVMGRDQTLSGLDAATGIERWRVGVPIGSSSFADGQRGLIFLAWPSGGVRALNVASGETVWEQALDASAANHQFTDPFEESGIFYIGDLTGAELTIRAFDAATGAPRWHAATPRSILVRLLIDGGIISVPDANGEVSFFDAKTGDQLGQYASGSDRYPTIASADGIVFVGSSGGKVDAVDPTSQMRLWRTELPVIPSATATLLQAREGRVFVKAAGELFAIDARDGSILWQYQSADLGPMMTADAVYVRTSLVGTRLDALDIATGSRRWMVELPEGAYVSVDAGSVFVGSSRTVVAFDAATGRTEWRMHLGSRIFWAPIVAGEALVVGGNNGRLFRLDLPPPDAAASAAGAAAEPATVEPLTSVRFGTAIDSPVFVGMWRMTVPAGAEATIPALAGPAAVYVEGGSIGVPDGIEIVLSLIATEKVTRVEHGQTALLPDQRTVRVENDAATAADLLVFAVVPEDERPDSAAAADAGLHLLAGGTVAADFPLGIVLELDRWTLAAGASLPPMLALTPDVVAVESGSVKVVTIPIGGPKGAAPASSVSIDPDNGALLPDGTVRLVRDGSGAGAKAVNLALDVNYDLPGGGGGGCFPRCLGSRR
jgi:outer membrane protein assembly factor BamB